MTDHVKNLPHLGLELSSRPGADLMQPGCFSQLIGKEVAVRYLSERIRRAEPRHIILEGRHGSGRASTARIYARGLHCESVSPDWSPCNVCRTCQAVIKGAFIDASDSSASAWSDAHEAVQSARAAATTPPWEGGWRTNLIRSAEVVPPAAWDVLLKTIEKPAYEQVFIFTTTRLSEIPKSIQSRCHTLKIDLLAPGTASGWLGRITSAERISCEPAALRMIVHASQGRPGQLLANLDKMRQAGEVTLEGVRANLSLTPIDPLTRVWQAVLGNDPAAAAKAVADWPDAPATMMDKLREILIFLLGRRAGGRLGGFDPMFDCCSNDVDRVSNAMSKWAQAVGLSQAEAALVILDQVSNVSAATLPELEAVMRSLIERLHNPPPTQLRGSLPAAGSFAPQLRRSGYVSVEGPPVVSRKMSRQNKHGLARMLR